MDAAIGSGQLAGIKDPTLRATLARLGSRHADVVEIRRVIADLDIQTAAVLGGFHGVRWDAAGNLEIMPDALRSFREDRRIIGAASAKYGFVGGYLSQLRRLEDAVDEILELIRDPAGN